MVLANHIISNRQQPSSIEIITIQSGVLYYSAVPITTVYCIIA